MNDQVTETPTTSQEGKDNKSFLLFFFVINYLYRTKCSSTNK